MNGQSVGKAISNSIRLVVVASLLVNGEAQDAEVREDADGLKTVPRGKPRSKTKPKAPGTTIGGWRRNDRKVQHVKQGDLCGIQWEFMCRKAETIGHPRTKSPPCRSQSVHSSDEAG